MPFDMPDTPRASLKQPDASPDTTSAPATVPGQPQQPQMSLDEILQNIAKYGQHGRALRRATTMQEVGQKLAEMATMAEHAVVNEAEDWYDAHTVKRNIAEMKKYASDFMKLAKEADMINQRMLALYEDMGRILERYFEIPKEDDLNNDAGASSKKKDDEVVGIVGVSRDTVPALEESVDEDMVLPPKNPSEPPLLFDDEENSDPISRKNKLTLRAIKAVYARLLQKNPEMAKKFSSLPPNKIEQAVWKLVDTV